MSSLDSLVNSERETPRAPIPVPALKVAIKGTSCMAHCALTWVLGETRLGRSDVAKERVGVGTLRVQTRVRLVGEQMYALFLHTQKMPVSRERHPMRSNRDKRRRSGGGLGSKCWTASYLCHIWKEKLKAAAAKGERGEAGSNTIGSS